ncbi:MAG: LIM domain-containing protein [Candidatus Xenobia bacterium]
MAKGSAKKPGEPKCRGCGGALEGKPMVKIGGAKWHRECAEKAGKKIPREFAAQG